MIYLDSVGFKFLVQELKERVNNQKIRKVQSYDTNSFSLIINRQDLYFENKQDPIIYIREDKVQNSDKELNFILKLKKLIVGGVVKDISQYKEDRICVVNIEKVNMLGDVVEYKLIYEFLGKSINVILVNSEGKIEASMYSNISEARTIMQGASYIYPEAGGKYGKLMRNLPDKKRSEFEKSYIALIYEGNILTYNPMIEGKSYERFDSLNQAINEYFKRNNSFSQLDSKRKPILKYIKNNIKRLEKILKKIPQDLENNKGYEKYKVAGDLLASNLYMLKGGEESIELLNYYNNEQMVVELDKNLSPSRNLQKYYDRYAKSKRREESLLSRLNDVREELKYYQEQLMYTENETDILGLEEIEKELGLKSQKLKSTRHAKRELQKFEYEGYEIYVGRNSIENEKVTFEIGKPNDIWLHAKDVPGSHVVIKGDNPSEEVIYYAAKLAAKHSKLAGFGEVDYTKRKNVKKIPTSVKAQVTYDNYKTMNIKED